MTNCEHLIENALVGMEKAIVKEVDGYQAFLEVMEAKHNKELLKNVSITQEELWEIAQYVMHTWINSGEIYSMPSVEVEDYKEIAKKLWTYICIIDDEKGTYEELADAIGLSDDELPLCRRLER